MGLEVPLALSSRAFLRLLNTSMAVIVAMNGEDTSLPSSFPSCTSSYFKCLVLPHIPHS